MNGDSGAAPAATLEPAAGQGEFAWEDPPRRPAPAASPVLAVDGFEGPLDWLLEMARAKRIDLARLSIAALIEAFACAMEAALARAPGAAAPDLARWAGWTVMAAQLTELRSRLLLPSDAPEARAAQAEAEALRREWVRRAEIAAAADWLERRPQLGFEVFARGRPEQLGSEPLRAPTAAAGGTAAEGERGVGDAPESSEDRVSNAEDDPSAGGGDLTDLLRACLPALRLPPGAAAWQPPSRPFWSVRDAVTRIARLADGKPGGTALAAFLPVIPAGGADRPLRCRVAVSATFAAALELTRDGALALDQDLSCEPVRVRRRERDLRDGDVAAPAET